jgi:hypothetical protein
MTKAWQLNVIDADKDDPVLSKQVPRQIQPRVHHILRDRALEAVKVAVAGGEKRDISRERQLELELNRAKQLIGDQAMVIEILKKSR